MSRARLELTGCKEFVRMCKRLSRKRDLSAVLRQAANAAGTPIVKAVRGIWKTEAKDTGLSAKSVTKKIVRTKSGYMAIVGIDKDAEGESHGRKHVPSNIDHLVELGYQTADGVTVPARAPLRRGFEGAKDQALAAFESKAVDAVEKIIAKQAK